MKPKVCIDTGILSIFFSKESTPEVDKLMERILNQSLECYILKPVLCEVFFHLCQLKGKDEANSMIMTFIRKYHPILVDLDEGLILETGLLKCQHHTHLSYIDCMSIGFCLNEKIPFHTTEKHLKSIPQNVLQKLNVVKYFF